jgi:hypothetical protein
MHHIVAVDGAFIVLRRLRNYSWGLLTAAVLSPESLNANRIGTFSALYKRDGKGPANSELSGFGAVQQRMRRTGVMNSVLL